MVTFIVSGYFPPMFNSGCVARQCATLPTEDEVVVTMVKVFETVGPTAVALGIQPAQAVFPLLAFGIGLSQYITSTVMSQSPVHDANSDGYVSFRQPMPSDVSHQIGLPEVAPDPQKAGTGYYVFSGLSNGGKPFEAGFLHFFDPNPDEPDWAEVIFERMGKKNRLHYDAAALRDGAVIDVQTPSPLPYGWVLNYKCIFSYPHHKRTSIWGWLKWRSLGQAQAEHYLGHNLGVIVAAASPTDDANSAQVKLRERTTPLVIQGVALSRAVTFSVIDSLGRQETVQLYSEPNHDFALFKVKPGLVKISVEKSESGRIFTGREPDNDVYYSVPNQAEPFVLNVSTQPFPNGGK